MLDPTVMVHERCPRPLHNGPQLRHVVRPSADIEQSDAAEPRTRFDWRLAAAGAERRLNDLMFASQGAVLALRREARRLFLDRCGLGAGEALGQRRVAPHLQGEAAIEIAAAGSYRPACVTNLVFR